MARDLTFRSGNFYSPRYSATLPARFKKRADAGLHINHDSRARVALTLAFLLMIGVTEPTGGAGAGVCHTGGGVRSAWAGVAAIPAATWVSPPIAALFPHQHGGRNLLDATYATPVIIRPDPPCDDPTP